MATHHKPSKTFRVLPLIAFSAIILILLNACLSRPSLPTPIAIQNPATVAPPQIPTRATRTPTVMPSPTPTQPWLPPLETIQSGNLNRLVELHTLPAYTSALAISADDRWLAAGSLERVLQVWNLVDGSSLSIPTKADPGTIWSAAFSPDSSLLAVGSGDSLIRLYALPAFEQSGELSGHLYDVLSLDFSPEGDRLLSGSQDQTIRIWDLIDESQISVEWNPGYVRAVRYSPDGSLIASASGDGTLRLWNSQGRLLEDLRLVDEKPEILSDVRLNEADMTSAAFSPDGSLLAAGAQNRFLWLFSLPEFKRLAVIEAHKDVINTVSFSPDGSLLASGSEDGTVALWRVGADLPNHLEKVNVLSPQPGYRVSALLFSPDGKLLVTASRNADIILWGVPAE
jgi:WD40 repeat protein